MRIGSISQGKMKCDNCGQIIPYAGRYLIIMEKDGKEDDEKGAKRYYCVKCASEKGYAEERVEKGEHILTFFQKTGKLIETSEEQEEKEEKEEKTETSEEKAVESEENTDE